ncbi:Jag N-terminal domain-containing protein [Aquihabitans sp. G128]|uniref:Jag family protein n=1 Tax=Aquihabitans sp. G128 TaxID=2849779 RepID=UPI001C2386A6|nr:Jag N-terminal domain-containing protein [Aquihabitans sp. G128]
MEDAKEAALDQLGIDESEAEFEVLEEPKTGLFGRVRSEARVRARVVPKAPRPKQERRPRKQRARREDAAPKATGGRKPAGTTAVADPEAEVGDDTEAAPAAKPAAKRAPAKKRSNRSRSGSSSGGEATDNQEGNDMSDDAVSVDEQADIISEFLEGLLVALDVSGDIGRTKVDDDTVELAVEGNDLGLLIGPKGQTLTAVHELSRTVLQRRATGRHDGRVRIDIGGYRQRRQEALARFVRAQADEVLAQGVARSLEPMNAVDRKVVHDTVNEIDGVETLSEGVDPDRRVVIVPEGADA